MTKRLRLLSGAGLFLALALFALTSAAEAPEPGETGSEWFDDASDGDEAPASEAEAASERREQTARVAPSEETFSEESAPADSSDDEDPRALTDFKPHLDPHGQWVDDPAYGTVWVPHRHAVGEDFAPYVTNGHWGLTEDGDWIWVSNYPFGWVVFHYGRWVWTESYGWAWIPGAEYSHAWVVWRVPTGGYDYVGWAPAPPGYVWRSGVAVSLWYTPTAYYVFCPSPYVFSYRVHHHIIYHRHHVHRIARHTRPYRPYARSRYHHPRVGPSPRTARVPARAVPKRVTRVDPRAGAAAGRLSAARRTRPTAVPSLGTQRSVGSVRPTGATRLRPTTSLERRTAKPSGRRAVRPAATAAPKRRAVRSFRVRSSGAVKPRTLRPRVDTRPSRPAVRRSPARVGTFRSAPRRMQPRMAPRAPSRAVRRGR